MNIIKKTVNFVYGASHAERLLAEKVLENLNPLPPAEMQAKEVVA